MSDAYPTVRGYRIQPERKEERNLSFNSLRLKDHAAHAYDNLREAVRTKGANCVGKEDFYSGDTLPTDREAFLACSGCPSRPQCDIFRIVGRPAYGVFAGVVVGRNMENLDEEDK